MFKTKQEYFTEGRKLENDFGKLLVEKCGGSILHSDQQTDIKNHIDLVWLPPKGRKCTFDVKGARKNARNNNFTSEENTWVEFRNVKGNLGSLFGKEDYIAFEKGNQWLIVRRNELAEKCMSLIKENKIYTENPNENFLLYSRKDRKDIIMRIPVSLIENLACRKI